MPSIKILFIISSCYLFSVVFSEPRTVYRKDRIYQIQDQNNKELNDGSSNDGPVLRAISWFRSHKRGISGWIKKIVRGVDRFVNGEVTYRALLHEAPPGIRQNLRAMAPYVTTLLNKASRIIQEAVAESKSAEEEEYEDESDQR